MLRRSLMLWVALLVIAPLSLECTEAPKLASRLPDDVLAAFFVEDVPSLAQGKAWLSSLSEAFQGEIAVGILDIPAKGILPRFLVLAEVNPDKLGWFLENRLNPILQRNLGKVEVRTNGGITEIVVNDATAAYYAIKDGLLGFSMDRAVVADFVSTTTPAGEALGDNSPFKKLLSRTDPRSHFTFFLNFQRVLGAICERFPMSDEDRRSLEIAGFLDIEAYGGSAAKVDGAHVGSLHIVTSGKPRGFLPLAVGSSGPPTSARCVPGDFSLYARVRFSSFSDAWKQIKQTLRQMPDEIVMEEIAAFLERFREETGFDFEADVLGSLGGEAALAAAVPETLRIPDAVLLLEMKDVAKMEEIAGKLMPLEEETTQSHRNVTIRTADMGPLTVAYALHEKYLVLGTGISAVKSAIDAGSGRGSLAHNSKFQTALKHLGPGGHFVYLDVGSALPLYVTAIGDAIARNRGATAGGPLPRWQVMAKLLMSPLVTDVVLALSTYGDEEGVSLRAYSTFVGPHKLVAASSFMAGMLMPALMSARQAAQKAACMSNLREIAIAEMMYATDHEGKFSERLSDLCPDYIDYLGVFTCPAERGPKITRKEDIDSLSSYVLRTGLKENSPPNEVLIFEKPGAHPGGGNAAFVDGHVEWLSGPELERIAGSAPEE